MEGGVQARTFFVAKNLQSRNNLEIISINAENIQATTSSLFSRFYSGVKLIFSTPKQKPDIIEASNLTTYIPVFLLAKRLKVPAVAWIPDLIQKDWWKNFSFSVALSGFLLEKITTKLSWDHIIAMSKATRKKLIKAGVNDNKITVIYGGVETGKLKNLKVTKFTNPTICAISRLVPYKRLDDLINAIPYIAQKIPNISCKIIGEGNEKDKLQSLIKKLKLGSQVELLGNFPHQQAMKTLKQSHLFCLPSVVEGFGIVTIEAMAAGTPFVNARISPTVEITNGGKGGLLFEPNNPQDLAKKAINLLTNSKLYETKQSEGLDLSKRYDWTIIAKQTESLYKNVINAKNQK